MMLETVRTIIAYLIITAASSATPAPRALQKPSPPELLSAAAERGKEVSSALRGYTYYAELTIETISQSDTITGKYYRFSQISFDREGQRQEKVLESTSTLPKDINIGARTADSMARTYQFELNSETLGQYGLNYVGRERIDELDTLVFDVTPKGKLPDPDKTDARYLKGQIWIDEQDLCVVKIAGEMLPAPNARRIPKFETYFQNHDKYWFPAYTSADDSVRVGRYFTHVKVNQRFTGYKKVSPR